MPHECCLAIFKMKKRYFDDLKVGDRFISEPLEVKGKEVIEFAHEFDPQRFHLNRKSAKRKIFKGLIASGWHTAALSMQLCLASDFRPAGGILGTGGELIWSKPVRPGDALRVEIEVIETRSSRSRPEQGVVKVRITTLNQHGETVQTFSPTLLVDRRPDQR